MLISLFQAPRETREGEGDNMPDIGDFIRRSRRWAHKIAKCDDGFEKQQKKKQQKQKGKSYIYFLI